MDIREKLLSVDLVSVLAKDLERDEDQPIELSDRDCTLVTVGDKKFGIFNGVILDPEFNDDTELFVSKNGKWLYRANGKGKVKVTW